MSVLPNKYVPISHSLLGVCSFLVENIMGNDTVSTLWDRVRAEDRVRTFDRFADALTLLYAGGLLKFDRGVLRLANAERRK